MKGQTKKKYTKKKLYKINYKLIIKELLDISQDFCKIYNIIYKN